MVMGAWRISRPRADAALRCDRNPRCPTVLCTDKTGTLTENRMTIAMRPADAVLRTVSAFGGEAGADQVVAFGRLASQVKPFDPMELAFHRRAEQQALQAAMPQDLVHRSARFRSARHDQRLARADGSLLAAAKGAPEAIADSAGSRPKTGP